MRSNSVPTRFATNTGDLPPCARTFPVLHLWASRRRSPVMPLEFRAGLLRERNYFSVDFKPSCAHFTSSFTLSMVRSGSRGPAS